MDTVLQKLLSDQGRKVAAQKSDVYNFGVLLLENLTRKTPFGYFGYDYL